MKRRSFLIAATGAGALVVGWTVLRPGLFRDNLDTQSANGDVLLNGWITLTRDGRARLAVPRCEMGQGIFTALAMLAAEELDLPLDRIEILDAPLHKIFGNIMIAEAMLPELNEDQRPIARSKRWLKYIVGRQTLGVSVSTAGSSTLSDLWRPVRMVCAQARASIVSAAARMHAVDPGQCRTEAGVVILPNGSRLNYAEVLRGAKPIVPVREFNVKPVPRFQLIGTSPTHFDARAKGDGSLQFASDIRLPGMRYAALAMAPSLGARLVDFRAPKELRGAQIVRVPAGYGQGEALGVIADSWWIARQMADTLDITWNEAAGLSIDTTQLAAKRIQALNLEAGVLKSSLGDVESAFRAAHHTLKAEYSVPYLAHAAMEPMSCTAHVEAGIVRVWAPTQAPNTAIEAASRAAGVARKSVEMLVPRIGGGFGRRLEADFVFQAVAIATQAGGRPVQLVWTREQDFRHDFYRPAATARLSATIDAEGRVVALAQKVACDSVGQAQAARHEPQKPDKPDKSDMPVAASPPSTDGLAYAIPHQSYRRVPVYGPVPIGAWRSVDASYDGFFTESFIDELATELKRDPIALRRTLLADRPRHLATLELAIAKSGYGPERQRALKAMVPPRSMGIALFESVGSVVAEVAEVSIDGNRLRVNRVVCAIHCGQAVHPDGIAQQVEGAVIMGMGAALDDGIEIRKGRVLQGNFHQYSLPRMGGVPIIETHIVPSTSAPTGVGEAALPAIAPAIANAIFVLTGQRLRTLPLRLA